MRSSTFCKFRTLLGTVVLSLATFLGCLKIPEPKPRSVSALVVILDLSSSTTDAPENRCSELPARARLALRTPGVRRLDVSALGTGDLASGLEPVILVPWRRWDPSGNLYERPGGAEAEREAWLQSLALACQGATRLTRTSPIYMAIRRGAESLRAHCGELAARNESCDRRWLAVHSDLRENAEPAMSEHLAKRASPRSRPLPRLELDGLELSLCGVSITSDGEGLVAPDALSRVWQQVLGAQTPPFDAACPIDTSLIAQTGTRQ